MRSRHRSPQKSPSQWTASYPSSNPQQKSYNRTTTQCLAILTMCCLACTWSMGVIYFLTSFHSAPPLDNVNINNLPLVNPDLPATPQTRLLRNSISPPSKNTQQLAQPNASLWTWPIIHIISTRFMQGQGHLLSLGRSRLKLLEVICLPSIMKQSLLEKEVLRLIYGHTIWSEAVSKLNYKSSNTLERSVDPLFLWVIHVDPNLHPVLLQELNTILEPVKQYTIVVGSNTNYNIGIKSGGWRDGQHGTTILNAFPDKIFFPTNKEYARQLVTRAHEARMHRVVLETRLDADDAVNIEYFSVLHYTALRDLVEGGVSGFVSNDDEFEQDDGETNRQQVQPKQQQQQQTAKWIYWCPHRHIQWSPSTPFNNPNNDPGLLSLLESPIVCVTPGLTLGLAVGTNDSEVPRYEHTHVWWSINRGDFRIKGTEEEHDCGLVPSTRCAVFVENPAVSAFRARAMTSAGMHNVEALGKTSMEMDDFYINVSSRLWKEGKIEKYFGIIPQQAKEAADFLMDIYVDTVRDNLRGQCTKGHSCKISSVEKLQRTVDILEEEIGGVGFERDER